MTDTLERRMLGHQLVDEMLGGRTDFVGFELVGDTYNFRTNPKYDVLLLYLKSRDFVPTKNRLRFEKAKLGAILVPGIHLPYLAAKGAFMERSDFSDAVLDGADFRFCGLKFARLVKVHAQKAYFKVAMLMQADLSNGFFEGAIFEDATLSRANLQNANFAGARLTNAKLEGANLTGAILTGADLTNANLSGANLCRAHLEGAIFTRANQSGVIAHDALTDERTRDWKIKLDRPDD